MLVGWSETIRDDCLNAASEYYSGRKDNSIIAFGKSGKNVISRLASRAVMGTELISVESGEGIAKGNIVSLVGRKLIHTFKDELDHMEYVRSLSSSSMGGKVALDFIAGDHTIGKLNVDEKEFNLNPDATSAKILSSTSNSSSFILLSNFGEMLSQRMHISLSSLLSKKGIPHLNVVTIPKNLAFSNLEMVNSGLDELKEKGAGVVTFIEDSYASSREYLSGEFYQMVAKRVNEFSRKLAAKANLLKMQILAS
ncbi:hypothetical protein IX51_08230 [uncultured archaeon]|nr:hypothetical protein IX51_08230 [uncultured archaeon]HKJ96731.1 hypothetical protein [Thermoplasmataceae archaeon]